MKSELKKALKMYLLAMGDDELILGHRNSQWCGHAPILEEDIAFANIALDEIGHASIWYSLIAELVGEDTGEYPDQLVFQRPYSDFRNIQLVELPNGDWAFSMLRQYLFDVFESKHLTALIESRYQPLAEASGKIRTEEIYHLRHTSAWIKRLGLGTEESNRRLQNALDEIWPMVGQIFIPSRELLISEGYVPVSERLKQEWEDEIMAFLTNCELETPDSSQLSAKQPGRDQHSAHLKVLVTEMQTVAKLDSQASW